MSVADDLRGDCSRADVADAGAVEGGVWAYEPWGLRPKLLGEWVERCVERESELLANERAPY